jgi:drug/metabolite transporter (DMT)-like permease
MLLIAAGISGEIQRTHWSTLRSVLGLGYLIIFGSVVAFTAYMWLLQQCPPTLVATRIPTQRSPFFLDGCSPRNTLARVCCWRP